MRPLKAYIMPRRLSSARTGSSAAKLRASFFVADTWTVSVQPIDCFRHAKLLAWRRVERTPGYFPVANPRARTHFTTVNCGAEPASFCLLPTFSAWEASQLEAGSHSEWLATVSAGQLLSSRQHRLGPSHSPRERHFRHQGGRNAVSDILADNRPKRGRISPKQSEKP